MYADSQNFYRVERWFGVDDNYQAVHVAGDYNGQWQDLAYYSFGTTNQEPTYLKMTRVGTTLTAYWSADGNTWNQFAQTTFSVSETTVDVGLSIINVNGGAFQPIFSFFDILPNNLAPAPESPIAAITLPIAAVAAFVIYTHTKHPKITKTTSKQ